MEKIISVICKEPAEAVNFFTAGKSYPVKNCRVHLALPGVDVIDDEGESVFVRLTSSSHGVFEVIYGEK